MNSEWIGVKLGDICYVRRGSSPRPIQDFFSDKGMPWVKIADATSESTRFITKTKQCIKLEGVPKSVIVSPGTLIVSNSGTAGLPKFMGITACVHDGWLILTNLINILPDFLYYTIISNRDTLLHNAYDSVMKNLTIDMINDFTILLPPIDEQKAIARTLSKIDEKIELNNDINKNLEEMAHALFKRWFVDFEFPDENGEPYKSSGGEFEESELGLIPKGWKISLLEEFCEITTEGVNPSVSATETFEHYSIPAYDEGRTPVFELGSEIKSNKYKVDKNSILVSKLNPETRRVWRPYCLTAHAVSSTEFINYIPKDSDLIAFCYSVLNSESFYQFLISNTTGSTNSRQRAKPKATLNYKMAMGDRSIIVYFNRTVNAIYEKTFDNLMLNKKLADTRDSLLPKLMSGEVRVPVDRESVQIIDFPIAAESKPQYTT